MEIFKDVSKYVFSESSVGEEGLKNQSGGGILDNVGSMFNEINMEYLLYVVLLVTLIGISIYAYYNFIEPKLSPDYVANNEFKNSEVSSNNAELLLFHVKWCPHCKKLNIENKNSDWYKFKQLNDGKSFGNYTLSIKDGDPEEDDEWAKKRDSYNIEGYPSVVLVKDEEMYEYDAKIDLDTLEAFVEKVLS
tara:strand:- start:2 stop:574 length:573 start_codon:yes stop_codon:yes gene_type:complete